MSLHGIHLYVIYQLSIKMETQNTSAQSIPETENVDQNSGKRKRKTPTAKTSKTRPKIPTMSSKSTEHFQLIEDANGKKMYKCSMCTDDARLINGTKLGNLSQHLKHVHNQFFFENIETRTKDPLQVKRLRLLHNAVEIVAVNGRPFNYLLDSGYQAGIKNKLRKLRKAGIGLDFTANHCFEIKEHLSKMAGKVRTKIRKELRGKNISLMADICTKNNRSIFAISVQFIVCGKVQIRSLGLIELHESHTGEYLAEVLSDCLALFGIERKQVFCMTTDNGKNVIKMVRDFNQMAAQNPLNADERTTTYTRTYTFDNIHTGNTDDEIQELLAEINDVTDDDALDIIFHQQQLEQNNDMLSSLSANFIGGDMIWETTGVNCVVHTLQLALKDAAKCLAHTHTNVIGLAREVAKFLRNPSNRRELERKGCKLPRLECNTRWCSLCLMVCIFVLI